MSQHEDESGFTLIELLVVIIIIGILAAIAIPVFLSQKAKGYEASEKSDLRTVAQDIEAANVDAQDYRVVTFGSTHTMGTSPGTLSGTPNAVGNESSVALSNSNSVTVVGVSATAFCIKASSSKSGVNAWYYSSDKGGLLPSSNACTISSI